jgi:CO dehydrogenase/acetyl-CoA synthase beta subunit
MPAYLARKDVPGLEVFGGICLSRAVGGINPAAVEEMVKVTGGWGRVVWMPTLDAENVRRNAKSDLPFTPVSRNGELLPEVKAVLTVIARNKLVLATGHSSPQEDLMLVKEGHRLGVEHMVVTHPMSSSVRMNVAQMQEAAKAGGLVVSDSIAGTWFFDDRPRSLVGP